MIQSIDNSQRTDVRQEPRRRFVRSLADAWRPQQRVSRSAWCAENIRLPVESSAQAGRFEIERYPWVPEILDQLDNPHVQTITFLKATQVGGTTTMQAALLSDIALSPCPAMFSGPDADYVREQRDRMYEICEASPRLKPLVPPVHLRNDRSIDMGRHRLFLAWSGNTQRLSGRPCKRVWCTEVDRWKKKPNEGKTSKLVAERVKAFYRWLIFYEGAPIGNDSTIAHIYDQSDQRRFNVPCPHCNHYQELRFFPHREGKYAGCGGVMGLQDENGEWLAPEAAVNSVWYRCEKGCRIEETDKRAMVKRGVWCPDGQRVIDGKLVGTPKRDGRNVGYYLNSLYADTVTFGRVAEQYLDSREDDAELMSFFNNWLALRYHGRKELPQWHVLGRKLAGYHKRGTVPQPAIFLTAGIDKQADRAYYVVRAWGDGCTSWLVDRGMVRLDVAPDGRPITGSDLKRLDSILVDANFACVAPNPTGEHALMIRLIAADVGFQPLTVWNWIRTHPGDRLRAVAGDDSVAGVLWRLTVVEKSARTGKPYPGGLHRWGLDTKTFKRDIQDRWTADPEQPGAWLFYQDIVKDSGDYLRQVVNERGIETSDKRGRKTTEWVMIDKRTGNHYFDCEVYARAAAEMVVQGRWDNLAERVIAEATGAAAPPRPKSDEPRGGFVRRLERRDRGNRGGGFIRR